MTTILTLIIITLRIHSNSQLHLLIVHCRMLQVLLINQMIPLLQMQGGVLTQTQTEPHLQASLNKKQCMMLGQIKDLII